MPVPRVAAIMENPIQYHAPLFAHIAKDGRIDLDVLYLTDRGVVQPFSFHGMEIKHDGSLLEGYRSEFLKNLSPWKNSLGILDNWDPEIVRKVSGYDAVWFHGYNYLSHWLGFAGCLANEVPILLRGESEDVLPRAAFRRAAKRPILWALFSRVSAFLCIGHHNRRFYQGYGVPEGRLFNVPYGVDNAWFDGLPGERERWRAEVRQTLEIHSNDLVFVYTSKHRHPKRPRDAVRAFCQLSPDPSLVLLMLGDGPLRGEAEECYRTFGKGHRVIFSGLKPYNELRRYLAASDVLVFPSIENWGMALNEGLAAGLAIISSDKVVGATDIVIEGVNGFTYEAGNVDMLSERLAHLAENRLSVPHMKAASRRHAMAFSFDVATSGIVDAIKYVTGSAIAA